jgi:hypothetical protein
MTSFCASVNHAVCAELREDPAQLPKEILAPWKFASDKMVTAKAFSSRHEKEKGCRHRQPCFPV